MLALIKRFLDRRKRRKAAKRWQGHSRFENPKELHRAQDLAIAKAINALLAERQH